VRKDRRKEIIDLIIKIKFLKLKTFALPDKDIPLLGNLIKIASLWCNDNYLKFMNETFYETLEEHYFDNTETMGDGEYLDAMNWLMKHKQLDVAFSKLNDCNFNNLVVAGNIISKTLHIAILY
jgi:hypothetical protein